MNRLSDFRTDDMTDDRPSTPDDRLPEWTRDEILGRVRRLQTRLAELGAGGALLMQNTDRYYFTGTMQGGFVVVPVQGDPLILVRRDPDRAAAESPLPVEPLGTVRDLRGRIEAALGEVPEPLGLELDVLPVGQVTRLEGLLPGVRFVDASAAVMGARAVKSFAEVACIRRAATVVAEVVAEVPGLLAEGMTELALQAAVEYGLRRRGHVGRIRMRGFNQELFYGHIMAGAAAAEATFVDAPTGGAGLCPAFPQGASTAAISRGAPVVVDLVGNYRGYLSDQTRLFCLGALEPDLARAFEGAREVQAAVVAAARPGVPASDLYRMAVDVARTTGLADHFMGGTQKVRFVGHGIGLEVDEYPFLAPGFDMPLEEGMVFALEPKFVFPGRGVVGIEDTYRVTATGLERLTPSPQGLNGGQEAGGQ